MAATFVDDRPEAIAQREQADAINNSPRVVAQRFVPAGKARNRPIQASPAAVIQRQTGLIPRDGLDRRSVMAMVAESETTKFDMRGHTVRRHGQDVTDEAKATRRNVAMDSSFDTNALITRTVEKALNEHRGEINSWLQSTTDDNLVLTVDMSDDLAPREEQLGSGMRRIGGGMREKVEGLTEATVIFRKAAVPDRKKPDQRARDTEWHLLTAFPSE